MPDLKPHLERNLAQAKALGQTERVEALKARLAELKKPAPKPPDESTNKAPAKSTTKKSKGT